jgi:enoyl-CoA hydratase/carnithine racemase
MSDEPVILIDDAPRSTEGVRVITLNRPDRRNALNAQLLHALGQALKEADSDRSVRAIVVTGAGDRAFCAGGDLSPPDGDSFLELHDARGGFADLLRQWRHLSKPTVAAVNGVALGGGFGIVLACDFAIARENAQLGTPEIRRGLFPMMIARLVYEQLPRRIANELVLLGNKLDAHRAHQVGILNEVVPPKLLLDEAVGYAGELAKFSPAVMGLGRRAIYRQMDMPFDPALSFLHDQLTMNLQTEDAVEGITAFFEKREPVWKGR